MNPELASRIRKATGPFFNTFYFLYLVLDDHGSWRFFGAWFRSFAKEHSPLNEGVPWLPFKATNWLQSYLTRDMKIFEYGSGGSTVFFGQRAGQVFSVEHDPKWYTLIAENLALRGLTNCRYALCEPQPVGKEAAATGKIIYDCPKLEGQERGMNFDAYVSTIDTHPDRSFDLVLVDGRARAACIERARRKVREGGYLMLDNSNDPRFVGLLDTMKPHPRTDFHGIAPFWPPQRWRTSAWQL
jgi:hypothetical protein